MNPFFLELIFLLVTTCNAFNLIDPTINSIQLAFTRKTLTSYQLVLFYINQTQSLNPTLRAVIEINPDALNQAVQADRERRTSSCPFGGLHGIPILLKDTIGTKDGLNTTAGSLALVGSVVPCDAGVVRKLREAGAIVFGKASMSEWHNFRTKNAPNGWSARGEQGRNPYMISKYPCGSSSGPAIAVAANMVAVSLAAETDGSISCPSSSTSTVGIKPTVGLTSRAGVIPLSPTMDTIGPICRTVADAVEVLNVIVGFDERDAEATKDAEKYIPKGGYNQFLEVDGLRGKRIGILRKHFFEFKNGSIEKQVFEQHFNTMRKQGATIIDGLEVANTNIIFDHHQSGEQITLLAEFKLSLNKYLSELEYSPVKSLKDVIDFNDKHPIQERTRELGQSILIEAENTSGLGERERRAVANMRKLSREGLEKLMVENELDAVATPNAAATSIFAIGGYPVISVPAGYNELGLPFGISFGGLKGSEPKLIEIAYSFEQVTNVRKPPEVFENYA